MVPDSVLIIVQYTEGSVCYTCVDRWADQTTRYGLIILNLTVSAQGHIQCKSSHVVLITQSAGEGAKLVKR